MRPRDLRRRVVIGTTLLSLAGGIRGAAPRLGPACRPRRRALMWVVLSAAVHSACASAPVTLPPPPSDSVRGNVRSVAVVSTGSHPDAPVVPSSSPSRAAGAGARIGTQITAAPYAILLLPIALPAGALISMAVHAAKRPSDAELTASVDALKRLFDGLDVQERLRTEVIRFTREHARRSVLDGSSTASRPVSIDADAIIEVTAERVALEQVWDVSSDVALVLAARARLIGRGDGRELYATALTYRAGARSLTAWTADDCRALRENLLRATDTLAERIVDEMFLVDGAPQ